MSLLLCCSIVACSSSFRCSSCFIRQTAASYLLDTFLPSIAATPFITSSSSSHYNTFSSEIVLLLGCSPTHVRRCWLIIIVFESGVHILKGEGQSIKFNPWFFVLSVHFLSIDLTAFAEVHRVELHAEIRRREPREERLVRTRHPTQRWFRQRRDKLIILTPAKHFKNSTTYDCEYSLESPRLSCF